MNLLLLILLDILNIYTATMPYIFLTSNCHK